MQSKMQVWGGLRKRGESFVVCWQDIACSSHPLILQGVPRMPEHCLRTVQSSLSLENCTPHSWERSWFGCVWEPRFLVSSLSAKRCEFLCVRTCGETRSDFERSRPQWRCKLYIVWYNCYLADDLPASWWHKFSLKQIQNDTNLPYSNSKWKHKLRESNPYWHEFAIKQPKCNPSWGGLR